MGSGSFNKIVKDFVNSHYSDGKQDLYGVYILRNLEFCAFDGVVAMITIPNWMFLSSFEGLRQTLLTTSFIESMVHNGRGVWGSDFGSCSFTLHKTPKVTRKGTYKRLFDKHVNVATNEELERRFFERQPYFAASSYFKKIPGSPIAYWVSERVLEAFNHLPSAGSTADFKFGMSVGDGDQYIRLWHEVTQQSIGFGGDANTFSFDSPSWAPLDKGGEYRRWFGNQQHVVLWRNLGQAIKHNPRSAVRNEEYFFRPHMSWTLVTSGAFSSRIYDKGFAVDTASNSAYTNVDDLKALLGFYNSKPAKQALDILCPTLNFSCGSVALAPLSKSNGLDTQNRIDKCIDVSRADWDNFETSWDFRAHPLLRTPHPRLQDAFLEWQRTADAAFAELKRLEEENNRYWIDAYGLQDELTPEVPDAQITIRRANLERDVKSLISYAVGCMMGRYSLSQPGLQFAGGTFDPSRFSGDFLPDSDGILPITDESYFGDDIVSRFETFLRTAYGAEGLQDNLVFIADALTRRSDETPRERVRRYFLDEFISDHIQRYKKRPIYWLFTSGREKGFGALVYLHRYTTDTLATMRNDYVLELQGKLTAELDRVERSREGASARDAKLAERRLKKLRAQQTEVVGFQERLQTLADQHIDIDLDDGVAYNYTRFQGLLYEGADLKMADLIKKSAWKRELLAQAT